MIIAIDTGATKTLIVSLSDSGEMIDKHQFPTPPEKDNYIQEVIETIKSMSQDHRLLAITIGLPAVIRDQSVISIRNLDWQDFDIASPLQSAFHGVPVWLENDTNLGAIGAINLLPEVPHRGVYITISTGIGGGFVVDGRLEEKTSDSEFADITFEYEGRLIGWEKLVGGPAIARDYNNIDLSKPTDQAIIQEIAKKLSRGFMAFIPILRPDIIVVGGGVGAYYDLFAEIVEKELLVLGDGYSQKIITSSHPHEVVIYGCYYYAKSQLGL